MWLKADSGMISLFHILAAELIRVQKKILESSSSVQTFFES